MLLDANIKGIQALTIPGRLTPDALELAARGPVEVKIGRSVLAQIADCHAFMLSCVRDGRPIYGATTGFGPMVAFAGRSAAADQCDNLLDHLTSGHGQDLAPEVMRATLLVRLWSLAQGRSGISPEAMAALAAALRTSFTPAVPRFGSLGASGDLVPLAHAVRALQGRGSAYLGGRRLAAAEGLRRAGLAPLELSGRDALALVNGTSVTAAAGGLALARMARSMRTSLTLTALLVDLLGAATGFVSPALLDAFGHPHTARAGGVLRELLAGSLPSRDRPLQEPYSIRCSPQLLGAAGAALGYASSVVHDDLNAISDNPLFFADQDLVAHGGNFFGQPVAFAADLLSAVAAQLGNLAERQLDLLVDPHRNGGLPPMLAAEPGRQHGVQGVQLTATATVAAMRRAAVPASMQSLPTNGHNQDVVPFGTQAALTALDQADCLRWLHGALAVALRQSVHVGGRSPTAPGCAAVLDRLVEAIPPVDPDRALDQDVRRAADLLDEIARTSGGMD